MMHETSIDTSIRKVTRPLGAANTFSIGGSQALRLLRSLFVLALLGASLAALPAILNQETVIIVNLAKLPLLALSAVFAGGAYIIAPRKQKGVFGPLTILLLVVLVGQMMRIYLSRAIPNFPLVYILTWPIAFFLLTRIAGARLRDFTPWFPGFLIAYVAYYTAEFGLFPSRDAFGQSIFAGVLGQMAYVFASRNRQDRMKFGQNILVMTVAAYDLFVSGSRRFLVVFAFGFARAKYLFPLGLVLVTSIYLADTFMELPSSREGSMIRSVGYRSAEFPLAWEALNEGGLLSGCGLAADSFRVVIGSKGEVEFHGYFHNFYLSLLRAFGLFGTPIYLFWLFRPIWQAARRITLPRPVQILAGSAFGAAVSLFFDMPRDGPWVVGALMGILSNELQAIRSMDRES